MLELPVSAGTLYVSEPVQSAALPAEVQASWGERGV